MIRIGDAEPFFVLDAHTHMGRRQMKNSLMASRGEEFGLDQMIADMDRVGVDMVCAFPLANPHTDYREENERIIKFMTEAPDRILAYARIQPFFGRKAAEDILEYGARGVRGLKFHPFLDGGGMPVNDRNMMFPLMEAAAEAGLVVLIHSGESWNTAPSLIGDLADNFRTVQFIIAHSGLWEFHQEAIVTARKHPNIYLDTAEVAPPGVITTLVSEVGADRILYGSDHPMIPFGWEISKILKYAELDLGQMALIMGRNLAELHGIVPTAEGRHVVDVLSI